MGVNRITGLNSGLDTETLVTSLVSSYQKKVDTLTGNQKRHSWKQDAWKDLNKKTVSFYNGKINTMSYASAFNKKTTTSTNSSAVTILTSENAMNATQSLKVNQIASSAYATGGALKDSAGNKATGETKLSELANFSGSDYELSVKVGNGTEPVKFTFNADSTINDVISKLKGLEVDGQKFNANFDANQGRIYMAAATTGAAGSFEFGGSAGLLDALGLDTTVHAGKDAEIELNGETYTSNNGTFEINGLTITANEVTEKAFTITTKSDTSGVYDMVKDMLKEYNELIKEMDGKYYADPAKKYNMLTDDEKYAMSDKEVEDWEEHIKEGLLSKDSTLYEVSSALKSIMQQGFEVNGKTMYLTDFGISTGAYLTTDQDSRGVLHIDGDPDDSLTSTNADKLKNMIATDPDAVSSFFSQLAQGLRGKLFDMMKTTEYSSSFTIYEDKLMASQYSDYNSKITDATERLNKKQDSYYAKFTRMEKAMAKLNATQSNIGSYFGTGG